MFLAAMMIFVPKEINAPVAQGTDRHEEIVTTEASTFVVSDSLPSGLEEETYIPVAEFTALPEEPTYNPKYEIDTQLDYICACVQAEALNQGEYGMRLVADVIFNRADRDWYGASTSTKVINAPHQFAVVPNALNKQLSHIEDSTRTLVKEEALNRTDNEIIGFRTGHFGPGTPAYKYKDHYFTK